MIRLPTGMIPRSGSSYGGPLLTISCSGWSCACSFGRSSSGSGRTCLGFMGLETLILVSPDHINTSPLAGEQGATFIRTQVELLKTDKIIEAAVARVGRENLTSESKSLGQMISSFLTNNCHTITLLGRTDCAEKLVPVQFIARFLASKDVKESPEAFAKVEKIALGPEPRTK